MHKTISIFSGNANAPLHKEICDYVGITPGAAKVARFSDGEIFVEVGENGWDAANGRATTRGEA